MEGPKLSYFIIEDQIHKMVKIQGS